MKLVQTLIVSLALLIKIYALNVQSTIFISMLDLVVVVYQIAFVVLVL